MRRLLTLTVIAIAVAASGAIYAQQQEVAVTIGGGVEADGTTPLHHAARLADAARVQALLRSGARPDPVNRYGVTPLMLAAANADAALVKVLLDAGADATRTTGEGHTILMTAARTGNADAVRMLIERGAFVNAREGWLGESALMLAAAENHGAVVSTLARAGADVDAKSALINFPEQRFETNGMVTTYLNRGGFTPLMFAARQDAKDAVKALIAAGASLDVTDDDGATAMVLAIINGHFDTANLLLDAGANPNIVDKQGMGALYAAVEMSTLDSLFGRPMPIIDDEITPVEFARRLMARGADPDAALRGPVIQRHHNAGNAQMGAGTSPIFRAAKNGDAAMIAALLDGGAGVNSRQPNGTTPLMTVIGGAGATTIFSTVNASESGTAASIRVLLDRGIDVNAANDQGRTALHQAAAAGNDAVVRVLAAAGAQLDLQDRQGLTALDLASGRGAAAGGGRGGGGGGRGGGAPQVRASTAALLRGLMGLPPDPTLRNAPAPEPESQN